MGHKDKKPNRQSVHSHMCLVKKRDTINSKGYYPLLSKDIYPSLKIEDKIMNCINLKN